MTSQGCSFHGVLSDFTRDLSYWVCCVSSLLWTDILTGHWDYGITLLDVTAFITMSQINFYSLQTVQYFVFNYTGSFLLSVQFVIIVYFAWFYSLARHVIFVCMSWLKCFRYQFYVSGSVSLANILWSLKSISLPTFFIQWIKYQETPVPLSFSDTYTNTHNRGQGEENDSSVSFYH